MSFARNQTNQALWTERSKILAQYFRLAAPQWSTNPIAHAAEYERVRDLHVADLKPRKAAFTMPGTEQEPDFNGLFAVRRTGTSAGQDKVDLLLLRKGDEVMGGYSGGAIDGFVEGKITDGALHFTWREGSASGRGVARIQGETIRGTWGIGESEQGGGEWTGVRVKKGSTGR